MPQDYDLVIVGAGSGGLTAAAFAARLGARVALVEKHRIGGDCTWTGCVPSKALLKAAKVAHEVRTAVHYGILADPPYTDMAKVRDYVQQAIGQVYRFETPEELERQGIEVIFGAARFLDAATLSAGDRTIRSRRFLLTTGARPRVPSIAGVNEVPYITYEQIFDNDRLPRDMIVVGAGPIGMEMAQAYQRLGSQVTVVAETLLPKEEPEVGDLMRRVLESEGMRFLWGRARRARRDGSGVVIETDGGKARADLLLIASGRTPATAGLDLEKAGVRYSDRGIPVDDRLRTNVRNIYAAGDVAGGYQFTHFAGWQAFQAVRNALLPGSSSGFTGLVPWVTFTDPEVAHVGFTEQQARAKFGGAVQVRRWEMDHADRAVCENDRNGFVKVIVNRNGALLGATVVNARAGETITEVTVAMKQKMKIADVAGVIHAYPTYSTPIQQLAAEIAVAKALSGVAGKWIRRLSGAFHT